MVIKESIQPPTRTITQLAEFELLSAEQEKDLGLKIFLAKLALRNLHRLREVNLLPPQQEIETQNVLVGKKGLRLASVLQNELKRKPKTLEKKKANNEDFSSENQFLADVNDNDQMLSEKINSRNQIPSEFVAQQLKFAEEGFEAVDLLINSNLGLTVKWARMYQRKGTELEDLIVLAQEGLITAADRFNYRMGNKFSTSAVWWIRQKITKGIQEEGSIIRLPYHAYEAVQRIRATQQKLQQESGKEIPAEDIVGQQIPEKNQKALLMALETRQVRSLESPIINNGDDRDLTIADALPDSADTAEEATNTVFQEDFMEELRKTLRGRELEIISMYFGLDGGTARTLDQIGKVFGITKERVRQLEIKALERLGNSQRFCQKFAELVRGNGHLSSDAVPPQGLPT